MAQFRRILTKLAKVLLKLAMDKAVRAALPQIYKKLDLEMPQLLAEETPASMTRTVMNAIVTSTGGTVPVDATQVQAVMGLYSPIAAAYRNLRK